MLTSDGTKKMKYGALNIGKALNSLRAHAFIINHETLSKSTAMSL